MNYSRVYLFLCSPLGSKGKYPPTIITNIRYVCVLDILWAGKKHKRNGTRNSMSCMSLRVFMLQRERGESWKNSSHFEMFLKNYFNDNSEASGKIWRPAIPKHTKAYPEGIIGRKSDCLTSKKWTKKVSELRVSDRNLFLYFAQFDPVPPQIVKKIKSWVRTLGYIYLGNSGISAFSTPPQILGEISWRIQWLNLSSRFLKLSMHAP